MPFIGTKRKQFGRETFFMSLRLRLRSGLRREEEGFFNFLPSP
jgi:hypothetical protein